ncbi:MAK10-like protein, partial [Tanacetum coccineum]
LNFYDHVTPATRRTIDQSADGNLCDRNVKESWALLDDLALYDNESWNDPRDFAKPVKAISLPQDVLSTSDRRLIELENQVQRLMKAHIAPMQPIQLKNITYLCEICSGPHDTQYCMEDPEQAFVEYASSHNKNVRDRQFTANLGPTNFKEATNTWKDKPNFNWERTQSFTSLQKGSLSTYSSNDMINKINTLWKVFSEKIDDTSTHDTARNPMAQMNFTSTNYPIKEELRGKGIKNLSKLLSSKYLKEDEAKEERSVESSATEYKNHEITVKAEEVESEVEFEEETEEEIKEEDEDNPGNFDTFPTMKELRYHEWLLKNPRPPWVKAKIRTGNLNNVKFSCMIGHFEKKQAYLDMESPINVMSRLHYNWIMSNRLEPRRKPSNPKKFCNFIGRVKGLKVFIGNFTYKCDFMVLEDTTSVIDHDLGSVIFGKPFIETTGLVYEMKEGTVVFKKDKENSVFKLPHKIKMNKDIDFTNIKTDRIPPFVIKSDEDNSEKTHYSIA